MKMQKTVLLAGLLALASGAFAQNAPLEGITESTDPAKVRAVEQRAQEIMARQSSHSSGSSSGGESARTGAPADTKVGARSPAKRMKDKAKATASDVKRSDNAK